VIFLFNNGLGSLFLAGLFFAILIILRAKKIISSDTTTKIVNFVPIAAIGLIVIYLGTLVINLKADLDPSFGAGISIIALGLAIFLIALEIIDTSKENASIQIKEIKNELKEIKKLLQNKK
ncbi:MAG: hypothetical protein HON47_05270, partial [Candidatus Diapherotrites archaeon]|nr:hypothetical protein [Candidatus Diapherotrites archaeon]